METAQTNDERQLRDRVIYQYLKTLPDSIIFEDPELDIFFDAGHPEETTFSFIRFEEIFECFDRQGENTNALLAQFASDFVDQYDFSNPESIKSQIMAYGNLIDARLNHEYLYMNGILMYRFENYIPGMKRLVFSLDKTMVKQELEAFFDSEEDAVDFFGRRIKRLPKWDLIRSLFTDPKLGWSFGHF